MADKARAGLVAFFSFASLAFAITIITLIARELYPGNGYITLYNDATGAQATFYLEGQCLLTNNSVNICTYGYSVAAIGCVVSMILMCAPFGAPGAVTILLAGFNSIWWLGFAITVTVYDHNIESAAPSSIPWQNYNQKYRTDVIALAWTTFVCSFLPTLIGCSMSKDDQKKFAAPEKPQYPVDTGKTEPVGYPEV